MTSRRVEIPDLIESLEGVVLVFFADLARGSDCHRRPRVSLASDDCCLPSHDLGRNDSDQVPINGDLLAVDALEDCGLSPCGLFIKLSVTHDDPGGLVC